jgi:hypothetical protein
MRRATAVPAILSSLFPLENPAMLNETRYYCPECDEGFVLPKAKSRRDFLQAVGGAAALAAIGGGIRPARAADAPAKPAEELIRELYSTLTSDQKSELVLPYDHGTEGHPTRQKTYNAPPLGAEKRIRDTYTKPQQELVHRIVRSILASDEALERLSRHGKWDSSGSFDGCGAAIFGEPDGKSPFAWVFSGHHITLRCDGNSQPGTAWGGPIYYGHSEPGYSKKNVYYYQTEQVQAVFDSLTEKQRTKAMATNTPGDGLNGVKPLKPRHGIAYSELGGDQQVLVENVMRTLLSPFRKEDVEEVMQLVKANGGMQYMNLAFYKDDESAGKEQWHFWRLEGPGFVWNFRPLPHVHCFVNITHV